jgi:predicted hydrocarbon binding protein
MVPSKRASFEVYFSEDGLRQVSNPVRMKILEMLQENEGLELKDIYLLFEKSGQRKSKSTLWEHLKILIGHKLVMERPHPDDKRRKLFLLDSKFVGTTEMSIAELSNQLSVVIRKSIGDPLNFANGLFCAIRFGIESFTNFNLDPILKEIGKTIGKEVAKTLLGENLDELLIGLSKFWEVHKLGHLEVVSKTPITVLVTGCYACALKMRVFLKQFSNLNLKNHVKSKSLNVMAQAIHIVNLMSHFPYFNYLFFKGEKL